MFVADSFQEFYKFTSAPAFINRSIHSHHPYAQAYYNGVFPDESGASHAAPL